MGNFETLSAVSYPPAWRRHSKWAKVWALLMAVLSALSIYGAVMLLRGADLSGWLLVVIGCYLGFSAFYLYSMAHFDIRRQAAAEVCEVSDSRRLWIPMRRSSVAYRLVSFGFWGSIGLVAFLFLVSGGGERYRIDLRYFASVALMTILAGWALSYAAATFRRLRSLGISVSAVGVHSHTSWGEIVYRWENIGDVVVPPARSPIEKGRRRRREPRRALLVRLVLNDRGMIWARGRQDSQSIRSWGNVIRWHTRINVLDLDIYPPVVPHLLRFYFEHPELRKELGTQESVDRVRAANFTPLR